MSEGRYGDDFNNESLPDYIEDAKDSPLVEVDEKEELKLKLTAEFKNDPLYVMVEKEYDIISDDIVALDATNVFSTKDTVNVLNKYNYLYDAEKGESYVTENRIRWWLNEKDDDNLLFYFKLRKPGRSWVWDINGIIKAKIVAILRFAKNHQQKMIRHYATGIQPNTPEISDDNVVALIEKGNFDKVKDFDVLKQITLASIHHMSKEREAIVNEFRSLKQSNENMFGELEKLKEENETLMQKLNGLVEDSADRKEVEEIKAALEERKELEEKEMQYKKELEEERRQLDKRIKERDEALLIQYNVQRILKQEALEKWDNEKSWFHKVFKAGETEKEQFINDYIGDLYERKYQEYLSERAKIKGK